LYNAIKILKNIGTKEYKEESALDLVNVSFVAEDNKINSILVRISKLSILTWILL